MDFSVNTMNSRTAPTTLRRYKASAFNFWNLAIADLPLAVCAALVEISPTIFPSLLTVSKANFPPHFTWSTRPEKLTPLKCSGRQCITTHRSAASCAVVFDILSSSSTPALTSAPPLPASSLCAARNWPPDPCPLCRWRNIAPAGARSRSRLRLRWAASRSFR
jgi:hypothetical protein